MAHATSSAFSCPKPPCLEKRKACRLQSFLPSSPKVLGFLLPLPASAAESSLTQAGAVRGAGCQGVLMGSHCHRFKGSAQRVILRTEYVGVPYMLGGEPSGSPPGRQAETCLLNQVSSSLPLGISSIKKEDACSVAESCCLRHAYRCRLFRR